MTSKNIKLITEKILSKYNIYNPPINVKSLSKKIGIKLVETDLPDDISAIIDLEDFKSPYILVNKAHHPVRQRFSIAHELGHYFLHKPTKVHVDKNFSTIFKRDQNSSTALIPIEIEANKFAAHLLMPEELILNQLSSVIKKDINLSVDDFVLELSNQFKVSTASMRFRLQNLGVLAAEN